MSFLKPETLTRLWDDFDLREELYPDLDYSPVAERTRRAIAAIERVRDQRGGLGLVYAPHVTAGPGQIVDLVHAVVEAGASGVMFSQDLESKGIARNVLFLAGSAINTIKDKNGKPDPRIGLEAMLQAIEVHRSGELNDTPMDEHLAALAAVAERKSLAALRAALRQRYPM